MKKIGIMGGTFNPIHAGHIEIADAAYKQFELDEVWFMPNHIPAYKSDKDIISGEHRLNMISLAIKDYSYFKTSDFELKREGKTYSYETFTLLKDEFPDACFYFIMGADSLFYFDKWVHPEIIIDKTDILVASRDENGVNEINSKIKELATLYNKNCFYVIRCKETKCSSSEIRKYCNLLKNDTDNKDIVFYNSYIDKYLSSAVKKYIIDNKLY